MAVEVQVSGPFFDERRDRVMRRMVEEAQHALADTGFATWTGNMHQAFRRPTGRYQSFAHVVQRDRDVVFNDGWGETNRLPYGPWLEGVGSRNSPVTRFPGYFSLARAAAHMDADGSRYTQPAVDRAMAAMDE